MSLARLFRTVLIAGSAALTVAPAVAGAAPRITDYSLTGSFVVWQEPKPTDGTQWVGCVGEEPKLTLTLSGLTPGSRPLLRSWATLPTTYGFPMPVTSPVGFLNPGYYVLTMEGPQVASAMPAIGDGPGHFMARLSVSTTKSRGRFTLYSAFSYNKPWNGLNLPVYQPLPTRSVPYEKIEKPAGACSAARVRTWINLY